MEPERPEPGRPPAPPPHRSAAPEEVPVTADAPDVDRALAATGDDWSADLRALLAPGAGIGRRTVDSVDRTLRGRSAGGMALDLLGTGWHTLRLLLSDEPQPADGDGMGPGARR